MQFSKVDVKILKMKAGDFLIGKLTKLSDKPYTDRQTGEMTTIKQFHFDSLTEDGKPNGEVIVFGDAGFKNALSMAGVDVGQTIKVVKLTKSEMGGGRTVNNYEVYRAN